MGDGIDRGRDAFDRQAWGRAYEHLSEAERVEPLEVDDLERLAASAYLAGRSQESFDVWGVPISAVRRLVRLHGLLAVVSGSRLLC